MNSLYPSNLILQQNLLHFVCHLELVTLNWLDQKPELLFLLRGVDHLERIAEAGDVAAGQAESADTSVVFEDINSIFGIDLEHSPSPAAATTKPAAKKKITRKTVKKSAVSPQAKKTVTAIIAQPVTKKAAQKSAKKIAKHPKDRRVPK